MRIIDQDYRPDHPLAELTEHPDNECVEWGGARDRHGYGAVREGRKTRRAHRVAYERDVGPIPDGMDIDHRCRNRACVNPTHLEPVTRAENLRRGAGNGGVLAPVRTHCEAGHALVPSNLTGRYDGSGRKRCKECRRLIQIRYRARKAANP